MYRKCLGHGLKVRKEDVRLILSELDPVSSRMRQRRRLRRQYFSEGPNFIWHMDSYDKLKPYGICINGCIDGFSRKIMWLKAAQTSSNPHVIGGYFVEAMEEVGGGPRIVRTDQGTENVVVRDIQVFMRRDGLDRRAAEQSHIGGASTANQRIESWWGVMRKEGIEYWIQLLGELKDQGLFWGDFLDKALSQFCFMNIIQELNEIRNVWNTHRIRPSRNPTVPSGIPNIMFSAPHLWVADDHIVHFNAIDLATAKQTCKFLTTIPCDEDIFDVCTITMEESGLGFPNNTSEALDFYMSLRDVIRPQLFE
ncbi:uncharacterized protein LOC132988566 [Labrus mixtus]|uniref:uncharacterized protein LOC132988566 n=1 Tax=Labrus mixtus TaxID=508554 RepID=UPI0029BFD854|nr:uncharacterized protein LOC132988566 [Labrus mixtus]